MLRAWAAAGIVVNVDSRSLTRSQLNQILRQVQRQMDYYLRLWRRVEATGFPLTDPLVVEVCAAWESLGRVEKVVEGLARIAAEPIGRPAAHPLRNTTRNAARGKNPRLQSPPIGDGGM